MATPFKIISIKEIPFVLNREIGIEKDMMKHLQVSFLFVLQYREKGNTVALHAAARYSYDSANLLVGGATFIANVEGWEQMTHDEESIRRYDWIKELVGYGLAFINGQYFTRTAGSPLNNVLLPAIPVEEIVENLKVEVLHS